MKRPLIARFVGPELVHPPDYGQAKAVEANGNGTRSVSFPIKLDGRGDLRDADLAYDE